MTGLEDAHRIAAWLEQTCGVRLHPWQLVVTQQILHALALRRDLTALADLDKDLDPMCQVGQITAHPCENQAEYLRCCRTCDATQFTCDWHRIALIDKLATFRAAHPDALVECPLCGARGQLLSQIADFVPLAVAR